MERIGGLSAERQHDRKVFLRLLRRVRIEAKLTQAELAKMLGVTQARISKYEQGERRIDMLELKRICDAVRLPLIELPTPYAGARWRRRHNGRAENNASEKSFSTSCVNSESNRD